MTSVDPLIDQIRHNEAIMATNLELVRPNVRPAHEMAINSARGELERLRTVYQQTLLRNASIFAVQGQPADVAKFTSITTEVVPNTLVTSADSYYRYLATRVEEVMPSSRAFSLQQLTALGLAIRQTSKEIGVRDPPMPVLPDLRTCPTHEDLLAYVRGLVQRTPDNILPYYMAHDLSQQALTRSLGTNAATILVTDLASVDQAGVINVVGPVLKTISLTPGDVVDESFVISTVVQRGQSPKRPSPATTKPDKNRSNRT